jgi:hypothetical protein
MLLAALQEAIMLKLFSAVLVVLTILALGCSKEPLAVTPTPTPSYPQSLTPNPSSSLVFISRPPELPLKVDVQLPPGWARNDAPFFSVHMPHEPYPILAFNSWGDSQFCAGPIKSGLQNVPGGKLNPNVSQNGTTIRFGPNTELEQLKPGGAYVVWLETSYYGAGLENKIPSIPEYTLDDLSGIWTSADSKQLPIVKVIGCFKRGHNIELDILCTSTASADTVKQLNDLLASWRFYY